MIRRPKIGMKVNIVNVLRLKEYIDGDLVMEFDSSLGSTGVISDIRSRGVGHSEKLYSIRLDPPNYGVMQFWGTSRIEEIKDGGESIRKGEK